MPLPIFLSHKTSADSIFKPAFIAEPEELTGKQQFLKRCVNLLAIGMMFLILDTSI